MWGAIDVEMFPTKGVEYLLVIGFLSALILYWRVLGKAAPRLPRLTYAQVRARGGSRWFQLPEEAYYYHPGHGWVLPAGGDVVRVGMDDFAQKLLGKPHALQLPEVGARIEQGSRGWEVKVDSKSFDLLSPIDGTVVARNEEVVRSPELVNSDPYGSGWLLEVKTPRLSPNLKTLLHGRLARAWMGTMEDALFQRMPSEVGVVMQDGGIPITGIARALSPEQWDEIAKEFLLTR